MRHSHRSWKFIRENKWTQFKFDDVGYESFVSSQEWFNLERIVLEWLKRFQGKGSYKFNPNDGSFWFECEDDLIMMILKFGTDIRSVK